MQIDGKDLLQKPELATEVFGPSTLVIRYDSRDELLQLARSLEGQLTATCMHRVGISPTTLI